MSPGEISPRQSDMRRTEPTGSGRHAPRLSCLTLRVAAAPDSHNSLVGRERPRRERMDSTIKLNSPLLVAAWPGMGGVAVGAASHLARALQAEPFAELPAEEFFELEHVEVEHGIARSGRLPRSRFFVWKDPDQKRDLVIFLGEAQPSSNAQKLCEQVIEFATGLGIRRVLTFAAMSTQLHPSEDPRVFVAATTADFLKELEQFNVETLAEGQIGGLNGLLLGASANRGIEAACLLGEIPFFAAGLPNPKGSLAVLKIFHDFTGVEIDPAPLEEAAEAMEGQLIRLMEQLPEQGIEQEEPWAESLQPDEPETEGDEPGELDAQAERRIERLFERADRDRSSALELKRELDRLGVFERYEDRFLDLFRKGE